MGETTGVIPGRNILDVSILLRPTYAVLTILNLGELSKYSVTDHLDGLRTVWTCFACYP